MESPWYKTLSSLLLTKEGWQNYEKLWKGGWAVNQMLTNGLGGRVRHMLTITNKRRRVVTYLLTSMTKQGEGVMTPLNLADACCEKSQQWSTVHTCLLCGGELYQFLWVVKVSIENPDRNGNTDKRAQLQHKLTYLKGLSERALESKYAQLSMEFPFHTKVRTFIEHIFSFIL